MNLLPRIVLERRAVIITIVAAALVNIGVYAFVVYPLYARTVGATDRASAAATALRQAEQEEASAKALVASKSRSDEELKTFYQKVIAPDLPSARRLTYARLPALARKANVKYDQGHFEVDSALKGPLGRLHIRMVLQGEYGNIRQFLYQLETSPEFVIIDDVTLAQTESNRPLSLAIELSTYYRRGANGS